MATLSEHLTAWQRAWRAGIAPQLSGEGLLALKRALETDDLTLIQGATVAPPPLQAVQHWPVEAACAVSCYWPADYRYQFLCRQNATSRGDRIVKQRVAA